MVMVTEFAVAVVVLADQLVPAMFALNAAVGLLFAGEEVFLAQEFFS